MDPPVEDVMQRRPRSPKEGILHGMLGFILASSLIQLAAELGAFWWGFNVAGSVDKARTMVFMVACFYELIVVWNCRSESRSVFRVGFLSNKALLAAVLISVFSTLAVIYVPALRFVFQTVVLNVTDWVVVVFFSFWGLLVLPEVFIKRLKR
jgi:Ca2+-transporting ATPase